MGARRVYWGSVVWVRDGYWGFCEYGDMGARDECTRVTTGATVNMRVWVHDGCTGLWYGCAMGHGCIWGVKQQVRVCDG
eukprot:1259730-Pyramimonas_sp.AAC.1